MNPVDQTPDFGAMTYPRHIVTNSACRGRRVSRAEALRIVQAIGERAERERFEVADQEAARGIHWEDEA